jgi:hypothetical protein
VRERLDEGILHGVESVRLAAEKPVGDSVRHGPVTTKQFVEGGSVAADGAVQQDRIRRRDRRWWGRDDGHIAALYPPQS